MKADPSDAARFAALFGGARANRFLSPGKMVAHKSEAGKVVPADIDKWCGEPTIELWEQHLRGDIGLGVLPPEKNERVRFGGLDLDDYHMDHLAVLANIKRKKLPLIAAGTKSGGMRLLLFAQEPVASELMERALRNMAAQLGLKLVGAGGKTEIITTANIWMPHVGGSARCNGLKHTGAAMTAHEFVRMAEEVRLPPAEIEKLAAAPPPRPKTNGAAPPPLADTGAYAAKRLQKYCEKLASMADGQGRNTHLNKALHQMGRMIAPGWIERDTVERDLRQAAESAGMDPAAIDGMIHRRGRGPVDKGMLEPPPEIPASGRQPPVAVLIEIASSLRLFHAPDQTGYADIEVGGHRETWPVRGRTFKRWLARQYYEQTGAAASSDATNGALGIIESMAMFDGQEQAVHVRIGQHAEKSYVDLADAEWRAVEIDADGWRILRDPPIRFRRSRGMLPLPEPLRGGSVSALRPLLNVASDADFTMIVAWLLAALRPRGPYPVLVLAGEHGSAKSTFAAMLRRLVDPNSASLRALPRDDRDLFIAANNAYVLAFDNVSGLAPWISDTLCRLATGGGFATRELHTDQEEVLFDAVRPIILNGIEDVVTRPDLADRSIMQTLEPIPEDERKTEADVWAAFEKDQAQILGALLDAMAHGVRMLPEVKLNRLPRMADFAIWATACDGALNLPCSFQAAYEANVAEAMEKVLEADSVSVALRSFMDSMAAPWRGTAKQLLGILGENAGDQTRRSRHWPGAPHVLSRRLRRAQPFLRKIGIDVELDIRSGHASDKLIRITRLGAQAELPLPPAEPPVDDQPPSPPLEAYEQG